MNNGIYCGVQWYHGAQWDSASSEYPPVIKRGKLENPPTVNWGVKSHQKSIFQHAMYDQRRISDVY